MKNLFEPTSVQEVKTRIVNLKPESAAEWGTMTPAQALAHCSGGLEMAVGDSKLPRALIGRVIGGVIKPKVLGDDLPFRRNAPTAKRLIVADERELAIEKERLTIIIDRFVAGGPDLCAVHPHPFFGKLKPHEWAILMYKHIDHHLRQFNA